MSLPTSTSACREFHNTVFNVGLRTSINLAWTPCTFRFDLLPDFERKVLSVTLQGSCYL